VRSISFPFVIIAACGIATGCSRSSGGDVDAAFGGRGGSGGSSSSGGAPGEGGTSATGGTTTHASSGAGTGGLTGTGGTQMADAAQGQDDGPSADRPLSPDLVPPGGSGQGGIAGSGGKPGSGGTTAGTGGAGGTTGRGGSSGLDGGTTVTGSGGTTVTGTGGTRAACSPPAGYRNLFVEILGKTQTEVDAKLDKMVQQLFHGTTDQKIYYELGSDQAQIYDIASGDVRSEGQSYGMMMAVQMGMRTEFDKLWNYAASCMRQSNGTFTWSMQQGACTAKQTGFAPDGEEYLATALLLASRRWDTSTGIDYAAEAKKVLKALATQLMFSKDPACVYYTMNSGNSDASYVLPLFYAEWACFDAENGALWEAAATHGPKTFFHNACNKTTGLASERSALDGTPQDDFGPDAWRVPMNIMMDFNLDNADADWQTSYAKTHAAFWVKEGLTSYGDRYSLAGEKKNSGHGPGQDGVNAMLAFALPAGDANAKALLQRAWDVPLQTGQNRYYNGCLQTLAFLHTSGRFSLFYP
jgi:oligosaccharide reducing-end xylanase